MRTVGIAGADAPRRAAAELRARRQEGVDAALHLLDSAADDALPEEERSFVTSCGRLLRTDAFWLEWASGETLRSTAPHAAETLIVVARAEADLPRAAERPRPARAPIDAYGRPLPPRQMSRGRRVAVLGRASEQGAVRAALGDAADRLDVAIEPVFFQRSLPEADALLLPGGANMADVEPQIAAARAAIDADLPLLGLCLGMQCMTTALIRDAWPEAALEETSGPGPRRSFVRCRDPAGLPTHRRGDRLFGPAPDSNLASLLPAGATVRMNHRFHLARDAPLPSNVRLHGSTDGPVDAIELLDRRFCLGLQGHPELGCDKALHALWDAFLHAALR